MAGEWAREETQYIRLLRTQTSMNFNEADLTIEPLQIRSSRSGKFFFPVDFWVTPERGLGN